MPETDPHRRFSPTQRAALALATAGHCASCGTHLPTGWHADHITPHARGGPTTTANGQPLCPTCNLTKGTTMPATPAASADDHLRSWQRQALQTWTSTSAPDFLTVACPGAGKTTFAATVARQALDTDQVDRIVVVVPSDHLKVQWADAAARHGIELAPDWRNADGIWPADFHGVVVTYAQLARLPDLLAHHVARARTLAVLDEVHHAGTHATWGQALRTAFGPATRRLLLSGTPFRSDGTAIPWVRYGPDGTCLGDHSYEYGDAVADGVCRPVVFPQYEGRFEWLEGADSVEATFDDPLDPTGCSRRLRTALDPSGKFLTSLLTDAHRQLARLRAGDPDDARPPEPDAGGLVLCMDQDHARKVAALLAGICGHDPVVATSDDPDASDAIARFTRSSAEWLVAVRMVSEGVDIPRLRVLAYATNLIAPLAFQQAVGRVVRVRAGQHGNPRDAFVFLPDDPRLRAQAADIRHPRPQPLADPDPGDHTVEQLPLRDLPAPFQPLGSVGALGGIVTGDERLPAREVAVARALGMQAGFPDHPDVLLRVARLLRNANGITSMPEGSPRHEVVPKHVRRDRLRDQVTRLARRVALEGGLEYAHVHATLNDLSGCRRLAQATEEQLRAQIEHAQGWLLQLGADVA